MSCFHGYADITNRSRPNEQGPAAVTREVALSVSADRIARWAKAATGRKIALVPISAVASKPKSTDDRSGLRS